MKYFTPITALLALAIAITALLLTLNKKEEFHYVLVDKVFDSYSLKKEYEVKLNDIYAQRRLIIDSIENRLKAARTDAEKDELSIELEYKTEDFTRSQQELSNTFNNKIWDSINNRLQDFSKEKDIKIFLGINSKNMFINQSKNLDRTDEFIAYLNHTEEKK